MSILCVRMSRRCCIFAACSAWLKIWVSGRTHGLHAALLAATFPTDNVYESTEANRGYKTK